jgi:signal transduction histidine kinase
VRRRLVVAIAGVAAAAVILLAVPLGLVVQRSYRDQDLLRLQRDTIAATRQIDLGRSGDPIELPRSSDALAVYGRDGRRRAGRGPAVASPVVRRALRGRPADASTGGHFEVAVPLLNGERVAGAVRAERADAGAAKDTRGAWLIIGAIAAAIVLAATLAALLLGRRLSRPLERLAASARRLGEGDFSVRPAPAGIAEVDAVGSALDATARRLDELISRERAFSADASHQLRTPLQALRIELESIELRGGAPDELPAALDQVDRLQATIDTLLAVARDAPRTSTATSDPVAVLEEVEARWRGPLAAAARPLRMRVDGDVPRVLASGAIVNEIAEVLVANAVRHGRGTVTLRLRPVEGFVVLDVGDEGPGFSGDPEAAFERRATSANGHGIGLALARSLAHAEGGRLTVSRAGPSPVVTLTLPRVRGDEPVA